MQDSDYSFDSPSTDADAQRYARPAAIIPHESDDNHVHPYQPEDEPRGGRSGCAWGCAGVGGCLLLIGAAILILSLTGAISLSGIVGSLQNALAGLNPPARAQINSTQTIITGIQPLGQLVNVSVQLAKADITVRVTQGVLNACGFSANHVAQGTIEAGFDLTQVSEEDITYDAARNTFIIRLPAPQITSCRVDYIRQYAQSFTACAPDWDAARLLANYTAINAFRADAIEGGILDRARSEARLVLGNFVQLLTGSSVEIIYEEPGTTVIPASCNPDVPEGWSQNGAGEWSR